MTDARSTALPAPTGSPQLTLRAVITGMLVGALLTPCNVYSGLKIGWSFNMSIAAALISMAAWGALARVGARPWGLLENNINQTAASSSASIISAGLVAPIPALTLVTGVQLTYWLLVVWVFVVSALGVMVAMSVRRQMLERDRLSFPAGVATAETLREIYGSGAEAAARVRALAAAALLSGALKLAGEFLLSIPRLAPRLMLPAGGVGPVSLKNLGFALDPSLLMIGFGAIVGLRVALSMLLGAVLAWGVLGPWVLALGWVSPGAPDADAVWFAPMVEWLLWPGVSLMVCASLSSFGFSLARVLRGRRGVPARDALPVAAATSARWAAAFRAGLLVTLLMAVAAQMLIFGIALHTAILAVLFSYVLAVVAGRVSGETGITPIGAMGKITQLGFGALTPDVTTNLMAANVTGGAAGQCADLLHDLRTGQLVGARPENQAVAQVFGVLTGSLVGTAAYLVLIPDPQSMLLTAEWPAPAVATWKAVAEVFAGGFEALPPGSITAMGAGGGVGVALAILDHRASARGSWWVPSGAAMGLGFVIPAWIAISMCIGALLAVGLARLFPSAAARFTLAIAAGLVAGESLAGIAGSLASLLGGEG